MGGSATLIRDGKIIGDCRWGVQHAVARRTGIQRKRGSVPYGRARVHFLDDSLCGFMVVGVVVVGFVFVVFFKGRSLWKSLSTKIVFSVCF